MSGSISFMIILQVVLIALNAVFACAAIAVISMNAAGDEASEEEIRMMVDVGSERGTIDIEEKELHFLHFSYR